MAWVITKSDPVKMPNGNIKVVVTYTNGLHVFTQDFLANDLSDDYIAKVAAVRITALDDAVASFEGGVTKGTVVPIAPLAPDAAVLARQEFEKFARAAQILRATFGPEDQRTLDAVAQADALYRPEYIGLA